MLVAKTPEEFDRKANDLGRDSVGTDQCNHQTGFRCCGMDEIFQGTEAHIEWEEAFPITGLTARGRNGIEALDEGESLTQVTERRSTV